MESFETEIYLRYERILKAQGVSLDCPVANGVSPAPKYTRMEDLLDRYDVFCFDGYGTLYNRGKFVYEGALDWYTMLRAAGKELRLITNAASDVDVELAAAAARRGFAFTEVETISSGSLLKDLCVKLRSRDCVRRYDVREVYYIGRETGKHVLDDCGIVAVPMDSEPVEPIVAISSSRETPETYARAVEILKRPGAILLVLNSDAWAPKIEGTREPVSGALCERLLRDSACEANGMAGCETYYLGKPFPAIWNKVKSTIAPGARVLMVGDTLGTDVLGARVAGFDAALVVGRNVQADELEVDERALGIRPDYYL